MLLWTVPAEVSNLATVAASSPACLPSQVLPRCALVISEIPLESWQSSCDATWQALRPRHSPRLVPHLQSWPHSRAPPVPTTISVPTVSGPSSASNSRPSPVSPMTIRPCDRRPGGAPKKCRAHFVQISSESQRRWLDGSFPERHPRSMKHPRATGPEVDAFFLPLGGRPRESVSRFILHACHAECLFHRLAHSVRHHFVREPFVEFSEDNFFSAVHIQINDLESVHCQRCLSVQHRVQLRTQRVWSHASSTSLLPFLPTSSRREQPERIVCTPYSLQLHCCRLWRTVSETRFHYRDDPNDTMMTDFQPTKLSGVFLNTLITRALNNVQTNTSHTLLTGIDSEWPGYPILEDLESGRICMWATGARPRRRQTTYLGYSARQDARSEQASGNREAESHEWERHVPGWLPRGLRHCGELNGRWSCIEQRDWRGENLPSYAIAFGTWR